MSFSGVVVCVAIGVFSVLSFVLCCLCVLSVVVSVLLCCGLFVVVSVVFRLFVVSHCVVGVVSDWLHVVLSSGLYLVGVYLVLFGLNIV